MGERRLLFLDIDGVLVNRESVRLPRISKGAVSCVAALNRITDETGAEIVISSSWRLDFSVYELREMLRAWGVTGQVSGVTCRTTGASRGREIQEWLRANGPVSSVVIIDDDSDMDSLLSCLVRTDSETGLTLEDAEEAIALLNEPWS